LEQGIMVSVVRQRTVAGLNGLVVALIAGLIAGLAIPAEAAKRQPHAAAPVVERSASGTIIQPTTTIIPDGTGHSKVIVIPRRRSYLDTGNRGLGR
jgi:hypothetical protein